MRLLSAILRNYRIHRELSVEFDAARTLVGGPNESGKSTLVEAIHRTLFLRAKGNTEHHRAMLSTRHGGQPEVEILFDAEGGQFHLRKRFGPNGTATLTRTGGSVLQGDAAESELARLLGVPAGVTGRVALAQWSHLWVWQGLSGGDPFESAGTPADRLLSRLQQEGGAVALRSDRDARVAEAMATAHDATFTQAGKPKAGTGLERAEAAETEARDALARTAARRDLLLQTARDFEDAGQEVRRLDADLCALAVQQQALTERTARVTGLKARETDERTASTSAEEQRRILSEASDRIADLQRRLTKRETALLPATEQVRRLVETRDSAIERAKAADRDLDAAAVEARRLRQNRDRIQAAGNLLEKRSRLTELTIRDQGLMRHQDDARRVREQLAALPPVPEARLRRIQELERTCSHAEAGWKAMAAGLEVLASGDPVHAGGEELSPGDSRILIEETEVTVGGSVRLRIRPGGGSGPAEARNRARQAQEQLREELDSIGLADVAKVQEVATRRAELTPRVEAAEQLLKSLEADRLPRQLEEAAEALSAAEAEWTRRRGDAGDSNLPADAAAARDGLSLAETALRAGETAETACRAERDANVKASVKAADALARHQVEIDERTREMGEWRGQLRLLRELHGEDPVRDAALVAAQTACTALADQLARTRQDLTVLQPDLLDTDITRLERAQRGANDQRTEASKRLAVALAGLRSDGTEDPEAEWAMASARAEAAREHLAGVRNRAEAIRLLHGLFREEQQALADQFSRPLADRVAGYLQCLFGPGARAALTLTDGTFTGLHLVRSGAPNDTVPFSDLSGGTREQVAAAVRLAVAEILAADYGGTLPVVFDDAFAFSDPERVQTLQRMLDLAALSGLQVIVLSCTPSDYAALGAGQILLPLPQTATG